MQSSVELYRPAQVARLLGVSTSRVYQLVAARELPATRVGGSIRIPRRAWEGWLEERNREAEAAVSAGTPSPGVEATKIKRACTGDR
jgi:excisionase family DNA binding protein